MAPGRPILVTGAAGCIGAWVTARLVAAGAGVVAFDTSSDRRRVRLLIDEDGLARVPWVVGDVADSEAVDAAVADHGVGAIIHLAALQIPFCRADPVAGARVNVVGTAAVFEAARRRGVRRLVYASSIAAPAAAEDSPHLATLYGAYKTCDEAIARLYWQDFEVPSIGLRPHTVYGPGRDQGMTSAPSKAMLAAAAGRRYTIPFTGPLLFQYAGEVADAFIRCAGAEVEGAHLHDLEGVRATIADVVAAIVSAVPDAEIDCTGDALPFPADADEAPLRALVGDWRAVPLAEGTRDTIAAFRSLLARGLVGADDATD